MSDNPLQYVEDIYRRRLVLAERYPNAMTLLDEWATEALGRSIAAFEIALKPHEPQTTQNGVKVCQRCSAVAGVLVHAPCGEVQAIAAALSQDTEGASHA